MKLFFKGLIIGIGKILPGISGGLLAILLNVYDESIDKIVHFYNKDNIKYLFILGSGIVISILFGSKIILNLLNKYYLEVMLLFIGLIIGSSLELKNKVNKINWILLVIGFCSLLLTYTIKNTDVEITKTGLFIIGIIEAATIVIPGISGTAILMILGYYYQIMSLISNLTNINLLIENMIILLPFLIGIIIGILFFVKLMYILINKYHDQTYSIIIGISFGSIVLLFVETLTGNYIWYEVIISLLLFIFGYKVSKKFI